MIIQRTGSHKFQLKISNDIYEFQEFKKQIKLSKNTRIEKWGNNDGFYTVVSMKWEEDILKLCNGSMTRMKLVWKCALSFNIINAIKIEISR